MKKIKFTTDYYEGGSPLYEAGQVVDVTPETARHVKLGNAVEVDVEDEKPAKSAKADK
jgi:hypothetical protein